MHRKPSNFQASPSIRHRWYWQRFITFQLFEVFLFFWLCFKLFFSFWFFNINCVCVCVYMSDACNERLFHVSHFLIYFPDFLHRSMPNGFSEWHTFFFSPFFLCPFVCVCCVCVSSVEHISEFGIATTTAQTVKRNGKKTFFLLLLFSAICSSFSSNLFSLFERQAPRIVIFYF